MTTWYAEEEKRSYLVINMRVGDKWFLTRFNEKDGVIYNYEKFKICKKLVDLLDDPDIDDLIKDIFV
jgi:hypothetical protein